MPNGQGGGWWVDRESVMEMYDRYGVTLTGEEIRRRREAREQWMQRRREAARERTEHLQRSCYTIQPGETVHVEQGTYMVGRSFIVAENALQWNAMSNDLWFSPPPKPKRPVSAIFYPMVNECGY